MQPSLEDHRLARDLARSVGDQLVALRHELTERGAPPDELRDAGDRSAHVALLQALSDARPEDAVLSEEGADDRRRLTARRVWIVDPLDGTREFGIAGRDDWAVHVALVIDGAPVCGAVSMPARGVLLSTAQPPTIPPPPPRRTRLVVSRSRPPEWAPALAERLDAELVALGSAGVKAMAVVTGEVDVYAHDGGQHQWDNGAPAAVVLAAGGVAARLDGSPLVYNEPATLIPDLLVCRPELERPTLDALTALAII